MKAIDCLILLLIFLPPLYHVVVWCSPYFSVIPSFYPPLLLLVAILALPFLLIRFRRFRVAAERSLVTAASCTSLIASLYYLGGFDKLTSGFQWVQEWPLLPPYNLYFSVGLDGLSALFLLLTLFTFPLLFLAAWSVKERPVGFLYSLLGMEILLVLTFLTLDLLCFYILFESLLIPMFILIGIWGARSRKIKAAYYFFLYTLFGSLFMLGGIFYLYLLTGTTHYLPLLSTELLEEQAQIIWLCFFIAFAVKMPLFPLHIWLPEAHVEAPTVGSMLLASLLLKLGGYGFLRFSLTLLATGFTAYSNIVAAFSLLGVIYGSLNTIRQIDLKRIIAYSSVAHMNMVMLGLASQNQQGLDGAVYLMIGHGVVSTALFFCIGVLYDRYHSRLLRYYGGLVTVMPLFASLFFAFTLANMGFPGTSNFLGEILLFLGIFASSSSVLLLSTAGIVLAAVYSVWLYNRIIFGPLKTLYIAQFTDLTRREGALLALLLLPMLFLGIAATPALDYAALPIRLLSLLSGKLV